MARTKSNSSLNTNNEGLENENINTDILVKICNALKCDVADIMEYVPEENVEPEVAVNGTSK